MCRGGRAGYPAWRDGNDSSDGQDPPKVAGLLTGSCPSSSPPVHYWSSFHSDNGSSRVEVVATEEGVGGCTGLEEEGEEERGGGKVKGGLGSPE